MDPRGAPEATNIPIANGPRDRKYKGKTIIYFFFLSGKFFILALKTDKFQN